MRWKARAWAVILVAAVATAGYAQEQGSQQGAQQGSPPSSPQVPAPKSQEPPTGPPPWYVTAPKLIHEKKPEYPLEAREKGIQGEVVLHATVDKDGNVTDISVISGPPLLVKSAIDAVKKWKYKPAMRGNQPIEVAMTISVAFKL
jgi:periplasmic protein TonB